MSMSMSLSTYPSFQPFHVVWIFQCNNSMWHQFSSMIRTKSHFLKQCFPLAHFLFYFHVLSIKIFMRCRNSCIIIYLAYKQQNCWKWEEKKWKEKYDYHFCVSYLSLFVSLFISHVVLYFFIINFLNKC